MFILNGIFFRVKVPFNLQGHGDLCECIAPLECSALSSLFILVLLRSPNFNCHRDGWLQLNQHSDLGVLWCSRHAFHKPHSPIVQSTSVGHRCEFSTGGRWRGETQLHNWDSRCRWSAWHDSPGTAEYCSFTKPMCTGLSHWDRELGLRHWENIIKWATVQLGLIRCQQTTINWLIISSFLCANLQCLLLVKYNDWLIITLWSLDVRDCIECWSWCIAAMGDKTWQVLFCHKGQRCCNSWISLNTQSTLQDC